MAITIEDRTGPQQNFDAGRGGESAILFVCHDTSNPNDRNDVDAATAKVGVEATIRWLSLPVGGGGGGVSAHYLIGPEPMGAPIYRLVNESDTAWHAGGNPPLYPSRWADVSTGKIYTTYDVNVHSIGVEVYRRPGDPIGPKQHAAMIALTQDVVSRHPDMLKLNHIVSHASIQQNRNDGREWVAIAGTAANTIGINKLPNPTPKPPPPMPPSVNPNPKNLAVGTGMTDEARKRGHIFDTSEQYMNAAASNPGIMTRSMAWAHDAKGAIFVYIAYQQAPDVWAVHVYSEIP